MIETIYVCDYCKREKSKTSELPKDWVEVKAKVIQNGEEIKDISTLQICRKCFNSKDSKDLNYVLSSAIFEAIRR